MPVFESASSIMQKPDIVKMPGSFRGKFRDVDSEFWKRDLENGT